MSDQDKMQDVCGVCHRTEEQAGKMVAMPNGMKICTDCMNRMMQAASQLDFSSLFQNMGSFPSMEDWMKSMTPQPGAETSGVQDGAQSGERLPDAEPVPAAAESTDQPEEGDEESSKKEKTGEQKRPGVTFLNLGDIFGGGPFMGQQQRAPKKKRKENRKPVFSVDDMPAPHKIKAELDKYVIGQEKAKKLISVAAYNHYKRVKNREAASDIEIEKSNILLIGPTGSGKTYLVRTLARILDVPLAITDATSLTEAGYIGDDIESVVSKLLDEADNDIEKTERGIIFIDEIDKIAKKKNLNSRDVSGEAVQQGMLKLLEGADIEVPVGASSKNSMVPMTTINTENILFICGGAFPELENIIAQRLMKKTSLGFGAVLKDDVTRDKNLLTKVTTDDLREFGMIPEFLGRLPITCTLENLDEEMLVRILKEPKNAILKQYQKLLALDEVDLQFDDEALHAIAKKALEKDTGARALRSIIEEFMTDIMYEIPKDENIGQVTITKEYVEGTGSPRIEIRTELPHTPLRIEAAGGQNQ
ncbi:MAG: ATP-dependent Clp protease ATP-binding subunit ClpX [Lachnospiraceae bacterium]|nr:ATP-dependent Clp protease ATP-binding subunit ClpX [Lachnospiraceae bacterium]